MFAIFAISAGLTWTLGDMTGSRRHGWTVWAAMAFLFLTGVTVAYWAEARGNPLLAVADQQSSALQPGGNMEGKEVRFGIANSALFAVVTTDASCGAVNSMHDSYTPVGGMVPLVNIMLGEVIFGGVGAGLYGMLLFVVLSVFIAGLMVGRTPEYLGKRIEAFDVKMAMLAILIAPLTILALTGISMVSPSFGTSSLANPGPHGLSEILYAYTSSTGNNGSAFAGLSANTPWYNTTLGLAMLFGRFLIIIPMLALAGNLARKKRVPPSAGTFPVTTPLFAALLVGVIVIVGALTFFPALSLGPIVEQLQMRQGQVSLDVDTQVFAEHLESANRPAGARRLPPQAEPAPHGEEPGDARRRGRVGAGDRAAGRRQSDGKRRARVRAADYVVAVADSRVRELCRGDGGRPREGAGRYAAPGQDRDAGEPDRAR